MAEMYVGLENGQKKLIPTSSEARSGLTVRWFIKKRIIVQRTGLTML